MSILIISSLPHYSLLISLLILLNFTFLGSISLYLYSICSFSIEFIVLNPWPHSHGFVIFLTAFLLLLMIFIPIFLSLNTTSFGWNARYFFIGFMLLILSFYLYFFQSLIYSYWDLKLISILLKYVFDPILKISSSIVSLFFMNLLSPLIKLLRNFILWQQKLEF